MKSQNAGLFLVLVIAAIFVSGCSQEELSQEELKQMITETAEKVDTYKLDMNMEMKTVMSNETESIEMTTFISGNGAVDQENRKMMMKLTTSLSGLEEKESFETEMEMYYIESEMYMKMDMGVPEFPARWMKMKMPEENWESQNQLDQQLELLNVSEIEILGSEEIDGIECYVLKITPDMEKLWEVITNRPGINEQMKELNDFDLGDIVKETYVKYWITKDTKFPIKTLTRMKMELTPEIMSTSDANVSGFQPSMTMDSEIEIKYYDYNEPVEIELPEEARNATEFPMMI
ncbi:MAG TPA: hypothetical protein EYP30_09855 [Archaeoglobaceae archaeon]|nr:hypothetical protein [Archaeoglobaceae archaeon]